MAPSSDVVQWAVALIRERVKSFEKLRCKASHKWKGGKRIHKLRTHARRLRAALEDLCDCTPAAPDLLARCKDLSDATAAARDSVVMLERLRSYRRFALPAERGEIQMLCDDLAKNAAKGVKDAKATVKRCRMEMQP